jgi:excisionase family DNA binding protein
MSARELLTISEAAKALGISTKTLRRWEKGGKISSLRTEGGHRRYDADLIHAFKNRKKKHQASPLQATPSFDTPLLSPVKPYVRPAEAKPTAHPSPDWSFVVEPEPVIQVKPARPRINLQRPKGKWLKGFVGAAVFSLGMLLTNRIFSVPEMAVPVLEEAQVAEAGDSGNKPEVLGATLSRTRFFLNVEGIFKNRVTFLEDIEAQQNALISGNLTLGGDLNFTDEDQTLSASNDGFLVSSSGFSVGGATTYYVDASGNANFNAGNFTGTVTANAALSVAGTLTANGPVNLGDGGDPVAVRGSTLTLQSGSSLNFPVNGDNDDFIYFSTSANQPGLFFAGATATNDPGIRVNTGSGQIEYRNQGNDIWTPLDNLGIGSIPPPLFTDGGTFLYPTGRESVRVFDVSGNSFIDIGHNGTTATITTQNTANISFSNNLISSGSFTLANDQTMVGIASYLQLNQGMAWGGSTTYRLQADGNGFLNNLTTAGNLSVNGGLISSTGSLTLDPTTNLNLTLTDNLAGSLAVREGANDYLVINTQNGSEGITLGNATLNPDYHFAGSGSFRISSLNCTTFTNGGSLTTDANGYITCSDDEAGAGSDWQDTAGVINLVDGTNRVTIGSAINLAKLAVDGNADEIQLLVQGHSTQTSPLLVLEQSGGNDVLTVDNNGAMILAGTITSGSSAIALTTATGYLDADAIQLITGVGSGLTGSGSGLQITNDSLGLIQGCSNGQILKWNDGATEWQCAADSGATSAIINVQSDGVPVGANVDTLNFVNSFSLVENTPGVVDIDLKAGIINFTLTNEQIHPKNALWHDIFVGGTSTASATIALQASTGDIITTGNLLLNAGALGINADADPDNFLSLSPAAGQATGSLYWGNRLMCDPALPNCGWATSAGTEGSILFTLTDEVIHPKNALFHDLAIGGTSTASAAFLVEATTGNITSQGSLSLGDIPIQNTDPNRVLTYNTITGMIEYLDTTTWDKDGGNELQNIWSTITDGSVNVTPSSTSDTFKFVAGANVALTLGNDDLTHGDYLEIAVTGLDNYGGWNLNVDSAGNDLIGSGEVVNIDGGTSISLSYTALTNTLSIATVQDISTTASPSFANLALTNQGELRLMEATANGSFYTGFKAPADLAANTVYTLPTGMGNTGQILRVKDQGTGELEWIDVGHRGSDLLDLNPRAAPWKERRLVRRLGRWDFNCLGYNCFTSRDGEYLGPRQYHFFRQSDSQ